MIAEDIAFKADTQKKQVINDSQNDPSMRYDLLIGTNIYKSSGPNTRGAIKKDSRTTKASSVDEGVLEGLLITGMFFGSMEDRNRSGGGTGVFATTGGRLGTTGGVATEVGVVDDGTEDGGGLLVVEGGGGGEWEAVVGSSAGGSGCFKMDNPLTAVKSVEPF